MDSSSFSMESCPPGLARVTVDQLARLQVAVYRGRLRWRASRSLDARDHDRQADWLPARQTLTLELASEPWRNGTWESPMTSNGRPAPRVWSRKPAPWHCPAGSVWMATSCELAGYRLSAGDKLSAAGRGIHRRWRGGAGRVGPPTPGPVQPNDDQLVSSRLAPQHTVGDLVADGDHVDRGPSGSEGNDDPVGVWLNAGGDPDDVVGPAAGMHCLPRSAEVGVVEVGTASARAFMVLAKARSSSRWRWPG